MSHTKIRNREKWEHIQHIIQILAYVNDTDIIGRPPKMVKEVYVNFEKKNTRNGPSD
jgi:hypothetical protein